jgi:hypothetical protein
LSPEATNCRVIDTDGKFTDVVTTVNVNLRKDVITAVVDSSYKFTACVNDAGGHFTISVIDTGDSPLIEIIFANDFNMALWELLSGARG